jgi:glycosyltransferase involved in cell wall biosynthesis
MKYSIIIPTLNEEKLLPQLLDQLFVSKVKNKFDAEIIVSDGGSKDKTLEIALKYADIVKTVHGKTNIAAGRNLGAEYARGDVIIFLNGDTLLQDPDYFFEFINKNFYPSKFLAMTCKVKVFPNEEILSDKFFHWGYNNYFKLLNVIGIGMGRGECQIVRKKIFNEVNGYNVALAAGEDFDLFKRIKKKGDILFTNDICVYESPRRFRKLGYYGVTWSWIKNGISVFIKNKSLSKEWEQVR